MHERMHPILQPALTNRAEISASESGSWDSRVCGEVGAPSARPVPAKAAAGGSNERHAAILRSFRAFGAGIPLAPASDIESDDRESCSLPISPWVLGQAKRPFQT